jgi:hypothetical protein
MLFRRSGSPRFHRGGFDFHSLAAVAAQEMVMVASDCTAAVNGLAFTVAEHINKSLIGEGLQNAVRRSQ